MGLVAPCGPFIPYPDAPRQKCDLWIGDPVEWVIEATMNRFRGDNAPAVPYSRFVKTEAH